MCPYCHLRLLYTFVPYSNSLSSRMIELFCCSCFRRITGKTAILPGETDTLVLQYLMSMFKDYARRREAHPTHEEVA